MSSNPCNDMDYRVETIKLQTRAVYGSLVTGQSTWARAWTVGCTPVTQKCCCSCGMRLVQSKCYVPLALTVNKRDYMVDGCVQNDIYDVIRQVFTAAVAEPPPKGIGHSPQSRAIYGVDVMLQWMTPTGSGKSRVSTYWK